MNGASRNILKAVAKNGEVSLRDTLTMAIPRHNNHVDQYPLALLIEEDYLGISLPHEPPPGAERMREFSLALWLHMFTLQKDSNGVVEYRGITLTGSVDPEKESVFLKAKGALYIDEQTAKIRERFYSFVVGVLVGLIVPLVSTWLIPLIFDANTK